MGVHKLLAVVYLIVAFALMLPLLGPGYYLTLDMQFGPNSFSDFQFDEFYGYEPSSYGAYLPMKMILAAFSQIVGVEILEKILLLGILFLCGFCMHISLPEELGNSRYFGGFLYMLNPFVFVRFFAGHWTILLSYALWPLAIKFFIDFIKKPGDNRLLAKVALITTIASISSHGVLLLLISYFIIFILHLKAESFRLLAKRTAILGGLILVMNLFWILPTLLLFEDVYTPASAEAYLADFGSLGGDMPLPTAILTMHGFWREGFTYTKDVFGLWYIPYLIIVALSVLGFFVLFRKNRKYSISLAIIFIIAFLISLGASSPLAGIFTILENRIPIHFVFRDSQKFVGLLCLVYSVFGTYGVHYLTQKIDGYKKTALLIALISIPVLYNFGFFGFLGQIGLTAFPQDWIEADRIIAADDTQSNIVVLPLHRYLMYPWVNNTQKTLGNPAAQFFSKPVIMVHNIETEHIYSDVNDPRGEYLAYMFDNRRYINNTAEMLLPLNARYIILLKNDEDSIHYLYLFYRMNGVEDIEKIYEGPSLYLFRNNLVKGPFISSEENGSKNFMDLMNKTYSTEIKYEEITPASYYVLESPLPYLVFTRSYNRFIEFKETAVLPWYELANGFVFTKEGTLENRLFYYTAMLFLLSWLTAISLILNVGRRQIAILVIAFVLIYLFMSNGLLKPSLIGWFIVVSVCSAVVLKGRNWKFPFQQNLLNIKEGNDNV